MEKKWVIVFLIYADFRSDKSFSMNDEMKIELNLMFGDIITTPLNDKKARLFVIMNGIRYSSERHGARPVNETKTMFYEIERTGPGCDNRFGDCFIVDSSTIPVNNDFVGPLQQDEMLLNVLKYIKVRIEEEVLFITWDHGSAFGIFKSQEPEHPRFRTGITRKEDLKKYPYLKLFLDRAKALKGIKKMLKEKKDRDIVPDIQIGNQLFKLANRDMFPEVGLKSFADTKYESLFKINVRDRQVFLELDIERSNFFKIESKDINFKNTLSLIESGSLGKIPLVVEGAHEILRNEELAKALKGWLKQKKTGVLLMMNCWMMNLHTMYSMRDCVEYLVAPQGDIALPGYNYRDILSHVYDIRRNFSSQEKLAKKCVYTLRNRFIQERAAKNNKKFPNTIDIWKIFAVNLQVSKENIKLFDQHIEELKKMVLVINESIKDDKFEMKYFLKYIRYACHDFTHDMAMMIDIVNWVLSIERADDGATQLVGTLRRALGHFREATLDKNGKNELVVAQTNAKAIYKDVSGNPTGVIPLKPTAYSLFFPNRSIESPKFRDIKALCKADTFLKDFLPEWKDFLHTAIDKDIFL